eukprot:257002-Alexandrium_andersonii.AAC.1
MCIRDSTILRPPATGPHVLRMVHAGVPQDRRSHAAGHEAGPPPDPGAPQARGCKARRLPCGDDVC